MFDHYFGRKSIGYNYIATVSSLIKKIPRDNSRVQKGFIIDHKALLAEQIRIPQNRAPKKESFNFLLENLKYYVWELETFVIKNFSFFRKD